MLKGFLISAGMDPGLATFLDILGGVMIAASFGMAWVLFGIWIERKVAARIQNRIGPNLVGPFGLIQNFADAGKLLIKEVIIPTNADRVVYFIAPMLSVVSVILIAAVIPFSSVVIGTDLSIGILYVIAVSSLGTLAVVMAGWGSNNKYALLGAFRSVAQLVSYEVPMVLTLLIPVMLASTLSMQGLVRAQHIAFIFVAPLSALVFLISSHAENGRAPFDLLEAESELVSGYNIEYSGMAFAMFYLAEFMHAFFVAIIFTVLFLGGWRGPGAETLPILGIFYLFAKSILVYLVTIWLRLTVPRVRIDQLLNLNWKILVPISLVNLTVVALVFKLIPAPDLARAVAAANDPAGGVLTGLVRIIGPERAAMLPQASILLVVNLAMFVGVVAGLRWLSLRAKAEVLADDENHESSPAYLAEPDLTAAK